MAILSLRPNWYKMNKGHFNFEKGHPYQQDGFLWCLFHIIKAYDNKENNTKTRTKPNANTKANTATKSGLADHPRQGHPTAADLGIREN